MRGWSGKLSPLAALAAALVSVTVVIAAYTGPIRPRTVTVQDGYVRTIYQNSPWQMVCRCAYADPGGRCADNDYGCFCGAPPYNNTALYTCYEDEPRYVNVTHNPATASGSFTCGTWGSNGWCRGGASLNVSGSEPVSGYSIIRMEGNYTGGNEAAVSCSGASCGFTPPQGQGTFWYWAVSSYGDTSAKNSLAYKFDAGAPTVSLSPSGTLGSNGWYRSNVTVTGSGSDAVSGLAGIAMSCPSCASCGSGSCFIQSDGVHTVTATATDNAGNSSTSNLTVRKDTVPPSLSYSVAGQNFRNGWYRSAVEFSANASDATSGVASVVLSCGSNPCSVSAEGQNTVTITATDYAGNSSSMSETVWIDTVKPLVSLSVPPADGLNGWYVSNVTATASGSDATSGIDVVRTRLNNGAWGGSSLTVTTDGVNYVYAQAVDVAGNESDLVYATVRRDTVPPVASLNIPTPNGQNGWFISNPTVSAGGTDATSGVAVRQVRVNGGAWQSSAVIGTDGVHTVEGRAQDYAGHWSSTVSSTVRVDSTPPTASVSLPPVDGQNGWYVSDVAIGAVGDDATSGVASREARLGSGAWQPNGLTITTDGTHTVTVRVTDNAGNSHTATATVQRDATPPTINGLDGAGTAGNNGWYVSDVEVSGVASDATSGIVLVEVDGQPNLALSEGVHSVLIRAVDEAGNQSTQAFSVRVDTTPPVLTPQLSPLDGDNGWYVAGATLDAAASDALSGLAAVRVRVDGGAWQTLPLDLTDEGVYDVEIEAEDEAGNLTRENLTVRIDRTAPTITPSIPAADGKNGWYVSPFEVSYATDDNLAGVQSSAWRLNNGTWQNGTPQIDGEGEIVLDIRAADNAGNTRIRRYTFTLDQTPPVGAITLTGEAGVEDWYRSAVEVNLTGEDAVSGVAEVRLPQAVIEAEGWHVVRGEVEDKAGWVTEIRRSFGIDLTPPQGGFDALPELLSGTVELAGDASDALSGLLRLEISFSMGYQWQEITATNDRWTYEWDTTQTNGGYKRLYLRLTDKAGNTYTTGVDVLVSNALPAAEITRQWVISESGQVSITPGDLPIRQVCLTIQDPSSDRKVEWCGDSIEDIPNPVQWDGKFADGTQAAPGQYPVTVQVTDIAGRTVMASGTVIIPAPTPTPTVEEREEATATKPLVIVVLPTATPIPTATPTQTATEEREEPTRTPPAVSVVLPTPQPTVAVKPPKIEVQAAVEVVRRALWPFLTLIGLAAALGYSAMRDERPKAIRKLAERMEQIKDLQEVK